MTVTSSMCENGLTLYVYTNWSLASVITTTSRRSLRVATFYWLPGHQQATFKMVVLVVWNCLHFAVPCYLVELSTPTAGHCQSHSVVSGALMVPWIRSLQLSQNLKPTTARPMTARTLAVFIQAPAQNPCLPALGSCVSHILSSGTVVTICELIANYKCSDSTKLNWYCFR